MKHDSIDFHRDTLVFLARSPPVWYRITAVQPRLARAFSLFVGIMLYYNHLFHLSI